MLVRSITANVHPLSANHHAFDGPDCRDIPKRIVAEYHQIGLQVAAQSAQLIDAGTGKPPPFLLRR
jgi:hypothetical protein